MACGEHEYADVDLSADEEAAAEMVVVIAPLRSEPLHCVCVRMHLACCALEVKSRGSA